MDKDNHIEINTQSYNRAEVAKGKNDTLFHLYGAKNKGFEIQDETGKVLARYLVSRKEFPNIIAELFEYLHQTLYDEMIDGSVAKLLEGQDEAAVRNSIHWDFDLKGEVDGVETTIRFSCHHEGSEADDPVQIGVHVITPDGSYKTDWTPDSLHSFQYYLLHLAISDFINEGDFVSYREYSLMKEIYMRYSEDIYWIDEIKCDCGEEVDFIQDFIDVAKSCICPSCGTLYVKYKQEAPLLRVKNFDP